MTPAARTPASGTPASGTPAFRSPSPDAVTLPYGSWPSPITARRLVEGAAGVSEVRVDGTDIWWNEQRPSEGGRHQLVRRGDRGEVHELFAPYDPTGEGRNWNARTAVMEYGGGAWMVRDGVVVFADWADQRLYRSGIGDDGSSLTPQTLTPDPSVTRGHRWSEPTWLDDHWLVCVRENHDPDVVAAGGEAAIEVVAVPLDGSAADDPKRVRVLVTGPDFVHTPAVRGDRLAWIQWDHPAMPWDSTTLLVGVVERDGDGAPTAVTARVEVAGGPAESIVQPGFTSSGALVFCTDRTGWWNPWRLDAAALDDLLSGAAGSTDSGSGSGSRETGVVDGSALAEPVIANGGIEAEIGGGLWVGGLRWWAELGDGRLVVAVTRNGADGVAMIGSDGVVSELVTPFSEVAQVVAGPDPSTVAVVASTPVSESAPYLITVPAQGEGDQADQADQVGQVGQVEPVSIELLRPARDLGVDDSWFSRPRHVSFPSGGSVGAASDDVGSASRTSHALFYLPTNPDVRPPEGELPPLVVMIHGGPTSAARNRLDLAKQFWTSRGFAVVDVNYGGSTGYGRPYRYLLQGAWGVVDVEDAVAAASYLAAEGLVDGDRLAIRGGSAGGYTTLAALCFHDTFKAGASHYGVADLSALASDTHKFESRYLDGLIGPWPEARSTYEARSPIHHTDGFDRPLIVLQGSEDEVVPPNQAEMIVAALAAKGVPHAYLLFEGEQHGFRQADNIVRALEAELWFYGRVFGFEPADAITPVDGAVGL